MAGLRSLRIQKNIYRFDVKKRCYSERHYRVKKKEPIDVIRGMLKGIFAPKKAEKKKSARMPLQEKKPAFNTTLAGVAIFIALIVLFGGWLFISLQSLQQIPTTFKPPTDRPEISNALMGGSVLTAGDIGSNSYVAAAHISYSTENIGNYTISLETYEADLPSEVFVLQGSRVQADSYPSFINYLRSKLSKKNILVNEITVRELETLPQGAIVLVPSGYIPKELLGVNSTLSIDNLADRGMVVVYIGQPFDRMLDGQQVVTTPDAVKQNIPFNFETTPILSTGNFSLYQPLYRVASRGRWSATMAYGSVSILKKGNGAFVFLPQSLDGGWRENPLMPGKAASEYAAEDVAAVILENPWAAPDGEPAVYVLSGNESTDGAGYFYSNPFQGEERSVKVHFSANSPVDPTLRVEDVKIMRVKKSSPGNIYIDGGVVVVSTNITSEEVRMFAKLSEPQAAQPNMYLIITDDEGGEARRFPQGRVNVQADLSIDVPIDLNRGEYAVALVDDESKAYAQCYMRVVTVDISWQGTSPQKPSAYVFNLEREGQPIELSSVKVKVDDGKYGSYDFTNVRGAVYVDVGGYSGGDALPPGDHTFTFTIGRLSESVPVSIVRAAPPLFGNPLFWITMIVSLGIAGAGVLFARREQIAYSVDIPDFPPITRTKIPLSPDTLLSLFERVNDSYRWKHTPLTLTEVKNGFKDIFYQGKPVYITDYNAEYLLDTLISKGAVLKVLGYFGSASWEKQAGRSMTYLAMMRKLRDICVNNAIPFTQVGESEGADSEITAVGQQMFLHFYDRSTETDDKKLALLIKKALLTIGKGITIILFKNDIKKRNFTTLLDSPSRAQLLIKIEVENGSVLLMTLDELENMIKELKNV
ncbi:hypothetical protein H0O02_01685 [Candidatus Micrarchaeota archaeon]|nr:hypothetical protein [Candidatus Micrarchaeota archaeon]